MPYIHADDRAMLDEYINVLDKRLALLGPMNQPGAFNYVVTRLVASAINRTKRYATIATFTGVLENVKQELYRRLAADYEDYAISRNGDIDEYRRTG
jgi:hypothetical protein